MNLLANFRCTLLPLRDLTQLRLSLAPRGGAGAGNAGAVRRLLQQHLRQLPAEQVRPLLVGLSSTWRAMQEEALLLADVNSLREELQGHAAQLRKLPLKVPSRMVGWSFIA